MKTVLIKQRLVINLAICLFSFISYVQCWEVSDHSMDCELVLVHAIFRHGDRNPIDPYPNDPYRNESFWPEGYGQLTKIGKMQQYELGKFLRKRYDGFLSRDYSPYEVYVQSSNIDRAIASAEANLAGLYPPHNSRSQWNPELNWQPIPVHSLNESIDNIINDRAHCPRYTQLYDDFLKNSDYMRKINEENQELYHILSNYTGTKIKNPQDVDYLMDVLFIEKTNNYTLPAWTEEVLAKYQSRLHDLVVLSFRMLSFSKEMQRLRGGPLLKEIISHINTKINKSMDERRKLFMYSGHDTTVATILNMLGLWNSQQPPYFSMVLFELHRNITTDEYFLEILLRNTTSHLPYRLTLDGCDYQCKITQFLELTRSKVPENWEAECQSLGKVYDTVGIIVGGLIGCLILGLFAGLTVLILSYIRNRRRGGQGSKPPTYPYLHLQMEDGDEEA